MVIDATQTEWNKALEAIFNRAAIDADFKALALKDARAALSKVSRVHLPEEAKIRFVEKVEELVIPLSPRNQLAGEIAEEALDEISGGIGGRNPFGGYYSNLPEDWRFQRGG